VPRAGGARRHARPGTAGKGGTGPYGSGILGHTAAHTTDIAARIKEILAPVERTMKVAGFPWDAVADGVVYITDVANFANMNKGYQSVITKDLPARATVRTRLVSAGGLVEIMFVAAK